MTPKQKIKSAEKKIQRLQNNNPDVDLQKLVKYLPELEKFQKLTLELFHLKFDFEHCQSCGKKL